MVIGALLLSILSGCGKKAGVDYIQENDSRQDAVSASDLHLNYSVSNGRTTVNVDADVNTSLSTHCSGLRSAVRWRLYKLKIHRQRDCGCNLR